MTELNYPSGEQFIQQWMIVKNQFPQYIQDESPHLIQFIETYYQWLDNNVTSVLTHGSEIIDIDKTPDEFVKYFCNEFAEFLNSYESAVDKREFIKNVHALYQSKGSPNSFRLFFRILFNTEIDYEVPKKDILMPSSKSRVFYNVICLDLTPIIDKVYEKISIGLEFTNAYYGDTELFKPQFYIRNNARLDITFEGDSILFKKGTFVSVKLGNTMFRAKVLSQLSEFDVTSYIPNFRRGDIIQIFPQEDDYNQSHDRALVTVTETKPGRITNLIFWNRGQDFVVGDAVIFYQGPQRQVFNVKAVNVNGAITKLGKYNIPNFVSETNPVTITIVPEQIYFNDTPMIEIISENGNGLKVIADSSEISTITETDLTSHGSGIDENNFIYDPPVTVLSPERIGQIYNGPIVSIFWFNQETTQWVDSNCGAKIWSTSPDGSRMTLTSLRYGISPSRNNLKPPSQAFLQNKILRLYVLDPDTGALRNTPLCTAYNLTIMPITNLSFRWDFVSQKEYVISTDRQVLDSLSSVIRSKNHYHEFSYVIKTPISIDDWAVPFIDTLHPAGYQLIPNIVVEDSDKIVTTTISKRKQIEPFLDHSPENYSWPNRIFPPVFDHTVKEQIDPGNFVFPARGYYDSIMQASDGKLINTTDEDNEEGYLLDINYQDFYSKIANTDDKYESKFIGMSAVEIERAEKLANDSYYWSDGWANHSLDLDAVENNIFSKNGVIKTVFTNYDGDPLTKDSVSFPKGSNQVRYQTILSGSYTLTENYVNLAYPADNTKTNPKKINTNEISPLQNYYIDPNGISVFSDFTKSSFSISDHITISRDTPSYDQIMPVFSVEGFTKASWFDYEPQGLYSDTLKKIGLYTQTPNGNNTTKVEILYTTHDGTVSGKIDGWFNDKNTIYAALDEKEYRELQGAEVNEITFIGIDNHGKLPLSKITYPSGHGYPIVPRVEDLFLTRESDLQNALKENFTWSLPEEIDSDETRATALLLYLKSLLKNTTKRVLIGQHLISSATNSATYLDPLASYNLPSIMSVEWDSASVSNASLINKISAFDASGGIVVLHPMWRNPFNTNSDGPTVSSGVAKNLLTKLIVGDPSYNATNYGYWHTSVQNLFGLLLSLSNLGIPVILKLFPECNLSTVWYGHETVGSNTDMINSFKLLFKDLINQIKLANLENVVVCFDQAVINNSEEGNLARWPGSEYVDVIGTELSGDNLPINKSFYAELRRTKKPILITKYNTTTVNGSYNLFNIMPELRKDLFNIIGVIFDENRSGNKYSIVDNTNKTGLKSDVWTILLSEVSWKSFIPKAKKVLNESNYIWQSGSLQGSRILYSGLEAFDAKWSFQK